MPNKIIRDGAVVEDAWHVVPADAESPPQDDHAIVPVSMWEQHRDSLLQRGHIGVWLDSDQSPKCIADDVDHFDVIAINFPKFVDGRGFSYARELREQHGYRGELRAIGAFIRDQLFFMKRCGFNAFALENTDLEAALDSLQDFSDCYQAAVDQPQPLFRRR